MDFQPGRAENLNERRREDMKLDLRVYAVTVSYTHLTLPTKA